MSKPLSLGERLQQIKKLEKVGIEHICECILNGEPLSWIARDLGVKTSTLIRWCESDGARAKFLREARISAAKIWDEQAIEHLLNAPDKLSLSRARDVAQHLRWRAQMVAPKDYAGRIIHEQVGSNGGPISVQASDLRGLTDEELGVMQRLMAKAAAMQSS